MFWTTLQWGLPALQEILHCWAVTVHTFDHSTGEAEASLVYIVSSGTAKATQWDPVWKRKLVITFSGGAFSAMAPCMAVWGQLVPSSTMWIPGIRLKVVKLSSKCLNQLCHLSGLFRWTLILSKKAQGLLYLMRDYLETTDLCILVLGRCHASTQSST